MRKNDDGATFEVGSSGAPATVTPLDIQQKEFRVSRFGGYRMRDVDEFLDRLTDAMSALTTENERLRARAAGGAIVGSPDLDAVSRQADEIIQRARDEAARLMGEAKPSGAAAGSGSVRGTTDEQLAAVNAFLSREREFLQSLAALVQEHAEGVKGMARQAREKPSSSMPAAPAGPGAKAESPPSKTESRAADAGAGPARPESQADRQKEPAPTQAMPAQQRPRSPATRSGPGAAPKDEPVVVEEPQPTGARRSEREPAPEDPSLRELFWGEES